MSFMSTCPQFHSERGYKRLHTVKKTVCQSRLVKSENAYTCQQPQNQSPWRKGNCFRVLYKCLTFKKRNHKTCRVWHTLRIKASNKNCLGKLNTRFNRHVKVVTVSSRSYRNPCVKGKETWKYSFMKQHRMIRRVNWKLCIWKLWYLGWQMH